MKSISPKKCALTLIFFSLAMSLLCGSSQAQDIRGTTKKFISSLSGAEVDMKREQDAATKNSLSVLFEHESNPVDGVFGPLTGGLIFVHGFKNESEIEIGLVGLREPGMSIREILIDDLQASWTSKPINFKNVPVVFGGTAWKSRMMDIYTNLGGLQSEATLGKKVKINLGTYYGTATQEFRSGQFVGIKGGVSVSVKDIEFSLSQMSGSIKDPAASTRGFYSRTSFEAAREVNKEGRVPLTLTATIQRRDYHFGVGGPAADKADRYILVISIEANIQKLFHRKNLAQK